jgi:hypothetical protein
VRVISPVPLDFSPGDRDYNDIRGVVSVIEEANAWVAERW